VVLFRALYERVWFKARDKRPNHKSFSDDFLWHEVYDFYAKSLPRLSAEGERDLIGLWQDHGDRKAPTILLEHFYYNIRPIAGEHATKRFPPGLWPSQRSIPKAAKHAYDGHCDRIHELASVGIFGLFVAADRFNLKSGYRFSTYASDWIGKYVQLFAEELVGIVPRSGDMGIEEQGYVIDWSDPDGNWFTVDVTKRHKGARHWVVYKPRRSVMDRIDAALVGERLYRGKAAGGMAVFDAGLFLDGIETEADGKRPDFEYLSTEGPTRKYLQRHVGEGGARFKWEDHGAYRADGTSWPPNVTDFTRARLNQIRLLRAEFGIAQEIVGDRIALKALSREVIAPWDKPNPLDDVEFTRGKRDDDAKLAFYRNACPEAISTKAAARHGAVFPPGATMSDTPLPPRAITAHGGGELFFMYGPSARQSPRPAEVSYLTKQRPDRLYNSWEQFEPAKPQFFSEPPKSPARDHTKHWDAEFTQHIAEQQRLFGGTDAASQEG
jgi:hypothetical protein